MKGTIQASSGGHYTQVNLYIAICGLSQVKGSTEGKCSHQPERTRFDNGLLAVLCIQFLKNVVQVPLDGLWRNEKAFGNGLVAESLG